MNFKKDVCRNFQRGSCQYGERCKFLHSTQQQSKPNVFGFGTQTNSSSQHKNLQQQKPNPFGFGVQNDSHSKGAADYGSRHNQFKPFENKWNRNITTGSSASRQSDNQPQAATHKCTDPESCKREIVEDFEHERPLWKLTCYSHRKNGPCDITGDISFEELRAAAYDDVKRGLSLQSIVERERSLLNAKLIEFENLLRNPHINTLNSTLPSGSPTLLAPPVLSALSPQHSAPFSAPSLNQLAPSINMGFGTSSLAPLNNAFQQSKAFQNFNQTSSGFGPNNLPYGRTDPFGGQLPAQTLERSPSAMLPQIPISASNQSPVLPNGFGQAQISNLVNSMQRENVVGDASIWLKEKWSRGEIPEEAPPDAFV